MWLNELAMYPETLPSQIQNELIEILWSNIRDTDLYQAI